MSDIRTIEAGRYFKRAIFFLDHDDGGYTNTYSVFDRDKDTTISVVATGHSRFEKSHKQVVGFHGREYPSLRDAIYAYEDDAP